MKKEDVKAMFEKERQEADNYVCKNIKELPKEAGSYNIVIDGMMTFVPMYADFDGEKWTDLKESLRWVGGDESKIHYYEKAPEVTKKLKP